jgi:mono/diheme cytochrome c family protein
MYWKPRMKTQISIAALLISGLAFAASPALKKEGIEGKSYKWNAAEGEKVEALKLKGGPKNGRETYEVCGACHLPSGAGRTDGTSRNWPASTTSTCCAR